MYTNLYIDIRVYLEKHQKLTTADQKKGRLLRSIITLHAKNSYTYFILPEVSKLPGAKNMNKEKPDTLQLKKYQKICLQVK